MKPAKERKDKDAISKREISTYPEEGRNDKDTIMQRFFYESCRGEDG